MSNSAAGSFGTKRQAERNYGAPPFSQRARKKGWGILIVTENDCARKGGPLRANTQKAGAGGSGFVVWLGRFHLSAAITTSWTPELSLASRSSFIKSFSRLEVGTIKPPSPEP